MAEQTLQLLASAYTCQSENITVTNPTNAYTDTESDTYATVLKTTSSAEYVYFHGFDFSLIPNNAEVTAMEFKIKGQRTYSTLSARLFDRVNGTEFGYGQLPSGSPDVVTITPSTSISDILALGDAFAFGVASINNHEQYVYGMEVNVSYTVPVPNKVDYIKDGVLKTLIDLTGDTATAEDVALGKLFHLANGEQATGTGGGGGLKYETGTWTPTSNVETGSITFANAHDEPPTIVVVSANVDSASQNYTMMRMIVVDYCKISNLDGTATGLVSGLLAVNRRATSSTTYQASTTILKKGGASTSTDYQSFRAYATASGITVYGTSSYYWRANVPCSWIAIWT